jgi:hypothetical protein
VDVTGRIIAFQEDRFRLLTDSGQVYLLTLGRHANLNGHSLSKLQRQRTRVAVHFNGEPNLAGGVALDVHADGR